MSAAFCCGRPPGSPYCAQCWRRAEEREELHVMRLCGFPSFSGLAFVAFISHLNHRSIDLSGDELKLKQLLESAGD